MRDEQVRRYSRHILLPDVGGLGQTALLVSSARLELRERDPDAELIAATYLAAGGVGTVIVRGASDAQVAELAAHGPDSRVLTEPVVEPGSRDPSREVALQPRPIWWPSAEGDATALAFWRGGIAATRWMAEIANR
ncbi:MAG TPA: hypothetical protein VNO30_14150 [Kofleriaceae bacterium]|nr:hypothetical protein [Kofleriaceae bacterium]